MAAEEGIKCYTLSEVDENFAYILDDVRPQVVIVDQVSWEKSSELIGESLKDATSEFKTCLLHKEGELAGFDFQMKLPIKVESFIEEVKTLLR